MHLVKLISGHGQKVVFDSGTVKQGDSAGLAARNPIESSYESEANTEHVGTTSLPRKSARGGKLLGDHFLERLIGWPPNQMRVIWIIR